MSKDHVRESQERTLFVGGGSQAEACISIKACPSHSSAWGPWKSRFTFLMYNICLAIACLYRLSSLLTMRFIALPLPLAFSLASFAYAQDVQEVIYTYATQTITECLPLQSAPPPIHQSPHQVVTITIPGCGSCDCQECAHTQVYTTHYPPCSPMALWVTVSTW